MLVTPFLMVDETPPPRQTAPRNSSSPPAQQAKRMLMAPEPTDVPHALAASLEPGVVWGIQI